MVGLRQGTRYKFSQKFRRRGAIHTSKQLTTFKTGDYVDIVVDPSQQKGMPHQYYQGKTGRVFNVNPRSIGVVLNKPVRHRIIQKRLHVRTEHLVKSKCRDDFLQRMKVNDKLKAEAKKKGETLSTKRLFGQPTPAHTVRGKLVLTTPKPFKEIF